MRYSFTYLKVGLFNILLFFVASNVVYSQQKSFGPSFLSPNAASLGLFGEIPVSHFTGVPNISIPLYEINTRSISIPINLNYHASGVRPDMHPGWVGQGWNLSVGAISRVIRKFPDEYHNDGNNNAGYYYTRGNLQTSSWARFAEGAIYTNSTDRRMFHDAVSISDLEPDEYRFNFLGFSGKFYIDQNGTWQVQSDQDIKLELDPQDKFITPFVKSQYGLSHLITPTFNKFTLLDNKGNKFTFGGAGAIEYSEKINPEYSLIFGIGAPRKIYGFYFWANTWNLSQIITANGVDTIDFIYERGPFISQLSKFSYYTRIESDNDCYSFGAGNWLTDGSFISPVYLKKIVHRGGVTVDFTLSESNDLKYSEADYNSIFRIDDPFMPDESLLQVTNGIPHFTRNPGDLNGSIWNRVIWLKLNQIGINDPHGGLLKTIHFAYDEDAGRRLFLNSVRVVSSDQQYDYDYSFSYVSPSALPTYLTSITDHWGYNNGNSFGVFNAQSIYSMRQPSTTRSLYGVLDTIRYPTGGKTAFQYELHDYSKVVDGKNKEQLNASSGIAGGLRIKAITSYSEAGDLSGKYEYIYKKNYLEGGVQSSGILSSMPQYYYGPYTAIDMSGDGFEHTHVHSTPVLPLTDGGGIHVGYTEVTEVKVGEGGEKSFTRYLFTNHDNGHSDLNANYLYNRNNAIYNPGNSRSFERGKPLKIESYNSGKVLVKSVSNIWARKGTSSGNSRAILFNFMDVATACNVIRYFPSSVSYVNYTYAFLLTEKKIANYSINGTPTVSSTVSYHYKNNYKLISEESTTSSTGEFLQKLYFYPIDNLTLDLYQVMKEKNMLDYPIRVEQYMNGKAFRTDFTNYTYWGLDFRIFPGEVSTQIGAGPVESLVVAGNYDKYGNLTSETIRNNSIQSYLWGYNGHYPIAQVKNAENTYRVAASVSQDQQSTQWPPGGTNSKTFIFTATATGDIVINAGWSGSPGDGAYSSIRYELRGALTRSGQLCMSYPADPNSTCPNTWASITINDVPPGNYNLLVYPLTNTASSTLNLSCRYPVLITYDTGVKEFFHENFEENGFSGAAHTGNRFYSGNYTVNFTPPNSREYLLSYWYRSSGNWIYKQESYTGPSAVLDEGDGIDDVRIFPEDAQMTTFTYDPSIGMTSKTDHSGLTLFYDYDTFQRLWRIRDHSGNIIKQYNYHYKP